VEGDTIIDYKTGEVFEETEEGPSIKAGYARQLRIYGYLVGKNLGWWPRRGILLPMIGKKAEIELTPDSCRAEAEEALALLEVVNSKITSTTGPFELASPSAESCGRCPFRIICPPYWKSVRCDWATGERYGDAEGVISSNAEQVHGGAAYALPILVERGSVGGGANVITPLTASINPVVAKCTIGTKARITGLCVRHNGQLAPTLYTLIMRSIDVPALEIVPN
jgi:hypothetical protein